LAVKLFSRQVVGLACVTREGKNRDQADQQGDNNRRDKQRLTIQQGEPP